MRTPTRKMTDDPVVLRIMDQLQLQGKTEKELIRQLGMSNGTFSSWKYGNVKSYVTKIGAIAEFLDVTEDYLLEGIDSYVNKDTLTATEIKLIKIFREMGNEQQRVYMKMGHFLTEATKFERMDEIISGNENVERQEAENSIKTAFLEKSERKTVF